MKSLELQLRSWQKFYNRHFGLSLDTDNLKIPDYVRWFDLLLIVHEQMKFDHLLEFSRRLFQVRSVVRDLTVETSWDLEERSTKELGTYVIWVRDSLNANPETAFFSANGIKERGLKTETLTERLLHGSFVFETRQQYLDTRTTTACTGTRVRGNQIPNVRFSQRENLLTIWIDGPTCQFKRLRARTVHTL
ncbi:hypothetical protein KW782_01545 [Candidatus Parcubacteria bacterium]|nr:hypothetical protein [Candidatus Parcubacteria bacterium]